MEPTSAAAPAFSVSNLPPPTSLPNFQGNLSTGGSPTPLLLSGANTSLSGQALPPLSVGANLLTQVHTLSLLLLELLLYDDVFFCV